MVSFVVISVLGPKIVLDGQELDCTLHAGQIDCVILCVVKLIISLELIA